MEEMELIFKDKLKGEFVEIPGIAHYVYHFKPKKSAFWFAVPIHQEMRSFSEEIDKAKQPKFELSNDFNPDKIDMHGEGLPSFQEFLTNPKYRRQIERGRKKSSKNESAFDFLSNIVSKNKKPRPDLSDKNKSYDSSLRIAILKEVINADQPLGENPIPCLGLNLAISHSLPHGKNIAINSISSDLNSHQFLSYRLFQPYYAYYNKKLKNEISAHFRLLMNDIDITDLQKVVNIGTFSMAAERIETNTAAMIRNIDNSI